MEQFNLKEFNKSIREDIARKALETKPYLVIIQVGNNPASDIYVRNKIKACEECNIRVKLDKLPEDISEKELLDIIENYNGKSYIFNDVMPPYDSSWIYDDAVYEIEETIKKMKDNGWKLWTSKDAISVGESIRFRKEDKKNYVTGIIVQMPLPDHIDPIKVCKAIDPNKDVDGFNPINVGRHALGEKKVFTPCTVLGISNLLKELNPPEWYKGKNCVIIGRSNIVGKPMAYEIINTFNCTTTICNSRTPKEELIKLVHNADIIICAVGKPNFLNFDYFYNEEVCEREKAPIVIDVGINRLPGGKIVGDCDYEAIKDYCEYVTPVPGGVGPLTITGLLHNVTYYKNYQV